MLCLYPSDAKLPQLHACEKVFDRIVVIVKYDHDAVKPFLSKTHNLPCIRTRDLSILGRADTVFILEPASFSGLCEFIAHRLEDKCVVHLLGPVKGIF